MLIMMRGERSIIQKNALVFRLLMSHSKNTFSSRLIQDFSSFKKSQECSLIFQITKAQKEKDKYSSNKSNNSQDNHLSVHNLAHLNTVTYRIGHYSCLYVFRQDLTQQLHIFYIHTKPHTLHGMFTERGNVMSNKQFTH